MNRPATKEDLREALKQSTRRITITFSIMMACLVVVISAIWTASHGG
ncbi:hypothetical protein FHS92_001788 [Sphingobium subterraneum]|uniref:Uncharacterized protein n=1 Tax=Sphingobium subterraneum TaxID=627688 RepID=A0A841IYM7_9SPHN|nr:hypothetical protein [Sphingobium subterraneum]